MLRRRRFEQRTENLRFERRRQEWRQDLLGLGLEQQLTHHGAVARRHLGQSLRKWDRQDLKGIDGLHQRRIKVIEDHYETVKDLFGVVLDERIGDLLGVLIDGTIRKPGPDLTQLGAAEPQRASTLTTGGVPDNLVTSRALKLGLVECTTQHAGVEGTGQTTIARHHENCRRRQLASLKQWLVTERLCTTGGLRDQLVHAIGKRTQ